MPAAEILRDVIVVAVRLVGNPLGRAEMDPAGHRPPGRVVHVHGSATDARGVRSEQTVAAV